MHTRQPESFSGIDQVTAKTLPLLGARLLAASATALALALMVDWRWAVAWGPLVATSEVWTWCATRSQRRGDVMTPAQRHIYLASIVWMNVVWSGLAVALWLRGDDLRVASACLLASQMLHAQTFTSSSRVLFAIAGGIPAAALLTCGLFANSGPIAHQVSVLAASTIMVGYMTLAAQENGKRERAMEAALARAEAADEAKSRFLAVLSHELRTPLTGVLGMGRALAGTKLDDEQRSRLNVMIGSGEGILAILNDVLDLSRAEAGHVQLVEAPFDLGAKIDSVLELWRGAADAKGLRLTWQADPSVSLWQIGDRMRFRQILNNLLGNAVKFTSQGGVHIDLQRIETPGCPAMLTLRVNDTGIGISEAQASRIFEPYAQASGETARDYGGTGLGLSICRQLLAAMGGAIAVESQLGRGSSFIVTFPDRAAEIAADPREAADASLAGLSIVLVDDHPVNLTVGKLLLEAMGAAVRTAASGHEALDVLQETTADLILLDIHMPDMDGRDTFAAARAKGLCGGAHVVALTGETRPEQVAELIAMGFDAVEAKPIDANRLAQTLAQSRPPPAPAHGQPISQGGEFNGGGMLRTDAERHHVGQP